MRDRNMKAFALLLGIIVAWSGVKNTALAHKTEEKATDSDHKNHLYKEVYEKILPLLHEYTQKQNHAGRETGHATPSHRKIALEMQFHDPLRIGRKRK